MSPLDAYLTELRAALGDRLPPAVHTARLREVRSHLLASAQEVGEAEAIRRYGRSHAVAKDLVRAHRGHRTESAWALVLPLSASFYAAGTAGPLADRFFPGGTEVNNFVLSRVLPAIALAFVFRAFQTRRWLAAPMFLAHVSVILTIRLYALLVLHRSPGTASDWAQLSLSLTVFAIVWFVLNAFALWLGRLYDLRRVR